MRLAGHVARMGERRGVNRSLVGKPEGNRPLERPMCSWEDNIRIEQVAGTCKCGNEPWGSVYAEISWLAENRLASEEGLCSMEQIGK